MYVQFVVLKDLKILFLPLFFLFPSLGVFIIIIIIIEGEKKRVECLMGICIKEKIVVICLMINDNPVSRIVD